MKIKGGDKREERHLHSNSKKDQIYVINTHVNKLIANRYKF